MVVREKNCYYAIALTDFFVFLSCAENFFTVREKIARFFNNFHLIIATNQEDEIVCII